MLEEPEALEILHHAYQRGINTWDTADVYSYGRSEEIVGKTLKKYNIPRERVVILSKCFFGLEKSSAESAMGIKNDGEFANRMGLSRKHILDAVEASVKRLGTYLDVLWIHRLDRETPEEEIMRALNDGIEWGWCGTPAQARWLRGNSSGFKTLRRGTDGTSLWQCKTCTTCCTEKRNAR